MSKKEEAGGVTFCEKNTVKIFPKNQKSSVKGKLLGWGNREKNHEKKQSKLKRSNWGGQKEGTV